jgi:hypothetical protein
MRMSRVASVTLALWLTVPPSHAQTYNGGQSSCQTWTDLRRTGRAVPEGNWIHGYMVAAYLHEKTLAAHPQGVNEKEIMDWIDGYCAKNPPKTLLVAAEALEANLKQALSKP